MTHLEMVETESPGEEKNGPGGSSEKSLPLSQKDPEYSSPSLNALPPAK